jgi:hypothetical protein
VLTASLKSVLTQNLANREFLPNSRRFGEIDGFCCQKRESPWDQKSRVSGGKRQFMAANSLLEVLTQIDRISKANRAGFEPKLSA